MTTLPATQEKSQQHDLAWWVVLIQGILSILIGVLLLASPGMTVLVLVQFLGIYWLVGGVLTLVSIFVETPFMGLEAIRWRDRCMGWSFGHPAPLMECRILADSVDFAIGHPGYFLRHRLHH
jgi:hypothetical protein